MTCQVAEAAASATHARDYKCGVGFFPARRPFPVKSSGQSFGYWPNTVKRREEIKNPLGIAKNMCHI